MDGKNSISFLCEGIKKKTDPQVEWAWIFPYLTGGIFPVTAL